MSSEKLTASWFVLGRQNLPCTRLYSLFLRRRGFGSPQPFLHWIVTWISHIIKCIHLISRVWLRRVGRATRFVCAWRNVYWVANKRFEISKFKFKIPRARTSELQARSRLYRSQILQINTRWKALAEIYTMHSFAPFSNLNFFVKNRQFFLRLNNLN